MLELYSGPSWKQNQSPSEMEISDLRRGEFYHAALSKVRILAVATVQRYLAPLEPCEFESGGETRDRGSRGEVHAGDIVPLGRPSQRELCLYPKLGLEAIHGVCEAISAYQLADGSLIKYSIGSVLPVDHLDEGMAAVAVAVLSDRTAQSQTIPYYTANLVYSSAYTYDWRVDPDGSIFNSLSDPRGDTTFTRAHFDEVMPMIDSCNRSNIIDPRNIPEF